MRAEIYAKEEFWCVDYIDDNYEAIPTVGMFKSLEDARQSALIWCNGVNENVAIVGKSSW
jgi:hypothetical protein